MNANVHIGRRGVTLTLAGLLAVACMLVVLAVSGPSAGHAHGDDHAHGHGEAATAQAAQAERRAVNRRVLRLHDRMRELWEEHVAWTRLAIVSFVADNPDLEATTARLLRNQTHIGNAIKPYYGRRAGNRLAELLREHITGAVDLLVAAKANDSDALKTATDAWYVNGNEVADFLNRANPRNWPRRTMRAMMRTHLDQTIEEAVAQLSGDYAKSVRVYDEIEEHIREMADALSAGIVAQFPRRFR
jgi:hypothetical protein